MKMGINMQSPKNSDFNFGGFTKGLITGSLSGAVSGAVIGGAIGLGVQLLTSDYNATVNGAKIGAGVCAGVCGLVNGLSVSNGGFDEGADLLKEVGGKGIHLAFGAGGLVGGAILGAKLGVFVGSAITGGDNFLTPFFALPGVLLGGALAGGVGLSIGSCFSGIQSVGGFHESWSKSDEEIDNERIDREDERDRNNSRENWEREQTGGCGTLSDEERKGHKDDYIRKVHEPYKSYMGDRENRIYEIRTQGRQQTEKERTQYNITNKDIQI
jgi:hypothetical protein